MSSLPPNGFTGLTETAEYENAIYQIAKSDPVVGGDGGVSNYQAQGLANRTAALKAAVAAEQARAENAEALLAPLNSPKLTGTPTAPTAAVGTSTTQLATTAFVAAVPMALGNWQENYTTLSANGTETITLSFVAPRKGRVGVWASANFAGQIAGNALLSTSCNGTQGSSDNTANSTGLSNMSCFEVSAGNCSVASFVGISTTGSATVGHTLMYLYVPE